MAEICLIAAVIGWFICALGALHIGILIEGPKEYERSPGLVWVSLFGPLALLAVLACAINEAASARRRTPPSVPHPL